MSLTIFNVTNAGTGLHVPRQSVRTGLLEKEVFPVPQYTMTSVTLGMHLFGPNLAVAGIQIASSAICQKILCGFGGGGKRVWGLGCKDAWPGVWPKLHLDKMKYLVWHETKPGYCDTSQRRKVSLVHHLFWAVCAAGGTE